MREMEVETQTQVYSVLGQYEEKGLCLDTQHAPLFHRDSNSSLWKRFKKFEKKISNPFEMMKMWCKWQILQLESIVNTIDYYDDLVNVREK